MTKVIHTKAAEHGGITGKGNHPASMQPLCALINVVLDPAARQPCGRRSQVCPPFQKVDSGNRSLTRGKGARSGPKKRRAKNAAVFSHCGVVIWIERDPPAVTSG
jgi:hypothetical protein